jgi:hypothetical protein
VVGQPCASSATPSGSGWRSCRAFSTRFHGIDVVAMSRHTGSAPARGTAIETGLVPRKGREPPCGATTGPACVKATPTSPCAAAARVYKAIAPQCDEPLTPTAPMPHSRASSIATALARWATTMPCPSSPATCAVAGPLRVTTIRGRAFIEPRCSRSR